MHHAFMDPIEKTRISLKVPSCCLVCICNMILTFEPSRRSREGLLRQYIKCFHLILLLVVPIKLFWIMLLLLLLYCCWATTMSYSCILFCAPSKSVIIHQKRIFLIEFFINVCLRSSRAIYFNNRMTAIGSFLTHGEHDMKHSFFLLCCFIHSSCVVNNKFNVCLMFGDVLWCEKIY